MLTCKYIQKFRDKNNIITGYRLQAPNGDIKDFSSAQIKKAIRAGVLDIANLTLTSDNRLVDTSIVENKQPAQIQSKPEIDYEVIKFLNRLILEFADHPDATENALLAAMNSKKYNPRCGGSAADDSSGLYRDCMNLGDKITKEDISALLYNEKGNKVNDLYNRMYNVSCGRYSQYTMAVRVKDSDKIRETLYVDILKLAGLPGSDLPKIKEELYMLSA